MRKAAGTASTDLWLEALRARTDLLAALGTGPLGGMVLQLAGLLFEAMHAGGTVLFFGNGGSAALAQHAAAELVGRFERERRALASLALTTDLSILTSIANDYGYDRVFERQIDALARPGDVAVALSTSGRSPNVLRGLRAARRHGATTVALLGCGGGPAKRLADIALVVPASRVSLIQEAHELMVHVICEDIDRRSARPGARRGGRRGRKDA